jgi:hypothetical protein
VFRRSQKGASLLVVKPPIRPGHFDEWHKGQGSHCLAAQIDGRQLLKHGGIGDARRGRQGFVFRLRGRRLPKLPQELLIMLGEKFFL